MKKNWKPISVVITVLVLVLLIVFLPKSCFDKNDVSKKHQTEKKDTTKKAISNVKANEILLQKKVDSLQKALNACQGEKLIVKKPIAKRKVIKKIAKPKILAAPIIVVAPKENKEVELSLNLNGITIEKKVAPQKKENPKIITPKKVINNPVQQEPENNNCPTCRTKYGKLGVKYVKN